MASIDADGMVQNVKASIEKYIANQLVMEEELTIAWEGMQFEPEHMAEWVRERILAFADRDYHRQVSDTEEGQTTMVMLSFNIFVNPEKADKTNRHYEIRDKIAEHFHINKTISLYDFSSDDFTDALQTMKVREIITDQPIPNDEWMQFDYTVGISWLEKW